MYHFASAGSSRETWSEQIESMRGSLKLFKHFLAEESARSDSARHDLQHGETVLSALGKERSVEKIAFAAILGMVAKQRTRPPPKKKVADASKLQQTSEQRPTAQHKQKQFNVSCDTYGAWWYNRTEWRRKVSGLAVGIRFRNELNTYVSHALSSIQCFPRDTESDF